MKRRIMIAALLLLTGLLAACANQTGSNEEAMISIVEKFQNARNDGDWELAATYLADDVLWDIPQGSLIGRDNWLATVKAEDTIPSSTYEDVKSRRVKGNTVIVEMIVNGPDFQSPAVAEVVVQDGKIQSYIVTAP